MATANSTSEKSSRKRKPAKPHKDFPLFPHASGKWAKKVRGKLRYFGKWDDPQSALNEWLDVKDYLLAGRTPQRNGEGITVREAINRWLTSKQQRLAEGEVTQRSFDGYRYFCKHLLECWGPDFQLARITSDDFDKLRTHFASRHNTSTLSTDVVKTKMFFGWCKAKKLIAEDPDYGPDFRPPSKAAQRKAIKDRPSKIIDRDHILQILDHADVQMKGMVLLGISAGYGPTDLATLPLDRMTKALAAGDEWFELARYKSGVDRKFRLWPETVVALNEYLQVRPTARFGSAAADRFFLNPQGGIWYSSQYGISWLFNRILKHLGIYVARRSFGQLRHTFATVAVQTGDEQATKIMMGHRVPGVLHDHYVDHFPEDRLRRVSLHVHAWLFDSGRKLR